MTCSMGGGSCFAVESERSPPSSYKKPARFAPRGADAGTAVGTVHSRVSRCDPESRDVVPLRNLTDMFAETTLNWPVRRAPRGRRRHVTRPVFGHRKSGELRGDRVSVRCAWAPIAR